MAVMTYSPYLRAPLAAYGAYRSSYPASRQTQQYTSGRSFTKVRSRRRRRYATTSSFKSKVLQTAPAKHIMTNDNQTQVTGALHSTIYTCNLTAAIVAGTGGNQRIGDAVQLLSLKVNGLLSSQANSTASCMYRVIVGWSGEEYNVPNTFSTAGLTGTEIYQANTGSNWANTAIINPKAFTVLDDRIFTLNNNISLVADIQEFSYTIPVNAAQYYQAAGSVFGKTRSLYMVFVPCILGGTFAVTPAGSVAVSTDLVFKNL